MNLPPLFADRAGDIAELVIGIVVLIVAGVTKLLSMANQQKSKPGAGQPPPPAKAAPRDALSNEIDEFLRRAAQRKQQTQTGPPRRQPVVASAKEAGQPAQAEAAARPVGGGLDKHLQQFTEEKKQFEQRAARLGDEVAQADDKIEAHLKEKFTRQLGSLEQRSGETAAPPAPKPTGYATDQIPMLPVTTAAGFAALLTTAVSLRQAIVLTEILNRPVDRWE
jgi:hypothetical protein